MDSPGGDKMQPLILPLDEELKELIEEFSAKLGLSQRRFVEVAVRAYLLHWSKQKTPPAQLNAPALLVKRLLHKRTSQS